MPRFYLRVEGVNLDAFIFDTDDLSTMRGGSLVLLHVVDEIDTRLTDWVAKRRDGTQITCVTTGASVGIWLIETTGEKELRSLVATVRQWLSGQDAERGTPLHVARHATFVVGLEQGAVENGTPSYISTRDRLLARARLEQMQSATVVAPPPARDTGGAVVPGSKGQVCDLDFLRPAEVLDERVKGESKILSASVHDRRHYGRRHKQELYKRELDELGGQTGRDVRAGLPPELPLDREVFALHFATVGEEGREDSVRRRYPLSGRIAVIYFDGNRFTGIQDRFIAGEGSDGAEKEIERQQEFDDRIKTFRRDLLHRILVTLANNQACGPAWRDRRKGEQPEREALDRREGFWIGDVYAMETLLWGGDETCFVVPARLGWRVARLIFETIAGHADPEITTLNELSDPQQWTIGGTHLHHAMGLVFCRAETPIRRVRALAKDLAEIAKGVDRSRSLLTYQVLESYDFVAGEVATARQQRIHSSIDQRDLVIDAGGMAALVEVMERLRGDETTTPFPRRQIRGLAHALARHGAGSDEFRNRLAAAAKEDEVLFGELMASSRKLGNEAMWLHVEDLWDYAAPRSPASVPSSQGKDAA